VDKGILGGCGEEVLFFVVLVLGLVVGNMGEELKVVGRSRGDRGTGNDVGGGVRDIEEGKVLDVVKGGPD